MQFDARYDADVEEVGPRIVVLVSLVAAAFATANALTWVTYGVLPALAVLFVAPAVVFIVMLAVSAVRQPWR
jgi:hypothetical protein